MEDQELCSLRDSVGMLQEQLFLSKATAYPHDHTETAIGPGSDTEHAALHPSSQKPATEKNGDLSVNAKQSGDSTGAVDDISEAVAEAVDVQFNAPPKAKVS